MGKHIAIRRRDGSSRYLNYKMTRLRVAVSRFWCKLWRWWYMEVKLIGMEVSRRKCSLMASALSLSMIAIVKQLMFSLGMKILHWSVCWWSQTLNEIREQMHVQLLELPERANFWNFFLNLSQSKSNDDIFPCQLFFYYINQLEVSCKQRLCSIVNQE